jgi:hypothetical protein
MKKFIIIFFLMLLSFNANSQKLMHINGFGFSGGMNSRYGSTWGLSVGNFESFFSFCDPKHETTHSKDFYWSFGYGVYFLNNEKFHLGVVPFASIGFEGDGYFCGAGVHKESELNQCVYVCAYNDIVFSAGAALKSVYWLKKGVYQSFGLSFMLGYSIDGEGLFGTVGILF